MTDSSWNHLILLIKLIQNTICYCHTFLINSYVDSWHIVCVSNLYFDFLFGFGMAEWYNERQNRWQKPWLQPKSWSLRDPSVFRSQHTKKQECILAGCVPSAAVAAGACIPACTGQSGVYPSMHLAGGVVCSWVGVSRWGVSAQGECLPHTPCAQNDRCLWKHYLAATTLQTVNIIILPICTMSCSLPVVVHTGSVCMYDSSCCSYSNCYISHLESEVVHSMTSTKKTQRNILRCFPFVEDILKILKVHQ